MDRVESYCGFERTLASGRSLFLFLFGTYHTNYRRYFLWIDLFIHGSGIFKEEEYTQLERCQDLYCRDLLVGGDNFIAIDECRNSCFFGCNSEMLPAIYIGHHSDFNLRDNRFENR